MDTEIFKQIVTLATITEKCLKKSFKLLTIKNKEVQEKTIDEIFKEMHEILNKITTYLIDELETIVKEIRQLENQKYHFLQQDCNNRQRPG